MNSTESTQLLQNSIRQLVSALQAHARVVQNINIDAVHSPDFAAAMQEVGECLRVYNDALAALTDDDIFSCLDNEIEEDGVDLGHAIGGHISIVTRVDYVVTNFQDLIREGRNSYRLSQPKATDAEVDAEVPDLAGAIHELLHHNSPQSVRSIPAAEPIVGITQYFAVENAMTRALHRWPQDPFEIAESSNNNLIYQHRDIYKPSIGDEE
ncbi:hypothetical protein [Nonomuraea typhae]|uniref:Uncharacterized protein n=1 Tax=Nonomuraea typhae TaxID=2603600 RepID=A0ABW7YTQ9_9ACTN